MEYNRQNNVGWSRVGRAPELKGRDRFLYRLCECVPGALSWMTIIGAIIASYFIPLYAAVFIIAFDVYWFLKTLYLSVHLRHNWKRTVQAMNTDWQMMLSRVKHEHIYHMVVLPFYKESYEIISKSLDALVAAHVDRSKMIVVLAGEERAGSHAVNMIDRVRESYASHFGFFVTSLHPADIPGEMPGKGSNISYACEYARTQVLDPRSVPYEDVIVSAFDIDTVVYPDYFACLAWNVLIHPRPLRASFQPIPFYNNNIWEAPAISRVVAFSGSFWQMVQQERPERLATFSSHAMLFRTLYDVGYWQKNVVSEDSRIFWNCYMAYGGDYEVVPLSYPVSMDANLAPGFWLTLKNVYLQQRRWSWGVENVPYVLFNFLKRPDISAAKKRHMSFIQLEGFWSLATNPILIFILGWLPTIIGQGGFRSLLLSYNLPIITRDIMFITMLGLVISAYIAFSLLPPFPKGTSVWRRFVMFIQWILVPITVTIFGAIPALDAQTRLLFGRYMGFWVTPKHRSAK